MTGMQPDDVTCSSDKGGQACAIGMPSTMPEFHNSGEAGGFQVDRARQCVHVSMPMHEAKSRWHKGLCFTKQDCASWKSRRWKKLPLEKAAALQQIMYSGRQALRSPMLQSASPWDGSSAGAECDWLAASFAVLISLLRSKLLRRKLHVVPSCTVACMVQ